MSTTTIVALLIFLIIHEVISVTGPGAPPRCQCITKEKRRIGRLIGDVEVRPPSSHCSETEIIATLKMDGQKICLDPEAPWVIRVLANKPAVSDKEEDVDKRKLKLLLLNTQHSRKLVNHQLATGGQLEDLSRLGSDGKKDRFSASLMMKHKARLCYIRGGV